MSWDLHFVKIKAFIDPNDFILKNNDFKENPKKGCDKITAHNLNRQRLCIHNYSTQWHENA